MYAVQRQSGELSGIWDTIKSVGSAIGSGVTSVASSAWDYVQDSDVLDQSWDAALSTLKHGTQQEVAQLLASNMSPDMRSALEREYIKQRAIDYAPYAIAGVAILALLLRRR